MAGEMTLAVAMGGDDTVGPKTAVSSGSVWSKVSRKVMNVMSFIRGLKSGQNLLRFKNLPAAPPRKEDIPPGSGEECPENPIISMMEKQELGKAVFLLAVPMTTGLVFFKSDTLSPTVVHFTLVANVAGSTAIWNGMLLRKTCSRIANVVEMAGVGSVFLGFHVLVGNHLPPELWFVPAISWFFSVLPFAMAAVPGGGTDQPEVKDQDVCCPV